MRIKADRRAIYGGNYCPCVQVMAVKYIYFYISNRQLLGTCVTLTEILLNESIASH